MPALKNKSRSSKSKSFREANKERECTVLFTQGRKEKTLPSFASFGRV
jgi:hypothetical protein